MGRTIRRGGLAAACLLLSGSLTAAANAAAGAGAHVWRLRGPLNTVYLAGSLHMLPATAAALPPALEHAYADAERLLMEIDPDEADAAHIGTVMLDKGRFEGGAGLRAAIGDARWARLQPWLERSGLPPMLAEGLEPWALALLLTSAEFSRLGMAPEAGVEQQLKTRAGAEGKAIDGLETAEYQLGLFDALEPSAQLRLLDGTLDDLADAQQDLDRLVDAWRRGDAATLESLLLEAYAGMPQLYESLVYRRNAAWVPRVRALLERDEDVLVVVGALHLVGERGVVALLAREGLVIERVVLH